MRIAKKLAEHLETGAAVIIILLLVAQVIVVALRYVFSMGWTWALDFLVYCFLFSVILPGLIVILKNQSVRVDVFYATWPRPRQRLVDRLALLLLIFPATGYAAWASLGSTMRSWATLESSPTFGGLPGYFILKTGVTLFFASLALAALALALRRVPYEGEEPE